MGKRLAPVALLIASLLCACSASVERRLEGRVFDIPKANNVSESDAPFFLPRSDPSDGFSFYLNPEASQPDQNLVGVASKTRMCARAAGTDALINSTVCAAQPPQWQGKRLQKLSDGVFWTYNLTQETGQKSAPSLANCFAMAGGSGAGLCTASLLYGDFVLTIYFRDDQAGSLQALYDESTANLQQWAR